MGEYDVQYIPRTVIKGEVIADFVAKFTHTESKEAGENPQWSIHMDGSSNKQTCEVVVVIHSPERDEVECMVRLIFPTTNNETEYEALIAGLDLAKATIAMNVVVYYDFHAVTSQVNGNSKCKNKWMKKYLEQVKNRVNDLQAKFVQIPREENKHADLFAKAASVEHMLIFNQVLSFIQISPLIDNISVQEIGS